MAYITAVYSLYSIIVKSLDNNNTFIVKAQVLIFFSKNVGLGRNKSGALCARQSSLEERTDLAFHNLFMLEVEIPIE